MRSSTFAFGLSSRAIGLVPFLALTMILLISGTLFASAGTNTANIGGSIWEGATLPDGSPRYTGNAKVINAKVMVQDMETGAFVAYGAVTDNTWTAAVPAPGRYVVMFAASDHDNTSREFTVRPGEDKAVDAYLPPLPLPLANMLVYAFKDNYVNGEDDYPIDPGLKGVTFIVKDEEGKEVARGISGTCPAIPVNAGPDPNGLYYFTGLKPGDYTVSVDMSTVPKYNPGMGTDWYLTTSEEGGHSWEVTLYPGDPGSAAGGYIAWFGLVEKIGQMQPSQNSGTISGVLKDADGPWFADEPFNPTSPLVTANLYVPNGLVILYTDSETGSPHPVATAEADPVTGQFTFSNVPPGRYKIFATDVPLDYIWQEAQATMTANSQVTGIEIYLPRWYARINGYVTDISAAPPAPVAGAKVNLRLEDGSIWKQVLTDDKGWYNFDKLSEVEVLGFVDVEPPQGYRGALDADKFNLAARTVQWYTYNHRTDLQLERIPAKEGGINGFVFNDNLAQGTWTGDGVYQPGEERTMHGVKVDLYDGSGKLMNSATTGDVDESSLAAQGWIRPYTWPSDEFGGTFKGCTPGYYEFRGLAPGNYTVKVSPPPGFSPSPAASDVKTVVVSGGSYIKADFGINTAVPLAGEIEGGVFDDINLDTNPLSLLGDEKAGIVGVPVGIYDHLGYFLGSGRMGSPLCYQGSTVCPAGEIIPQRPEVEMRAAPGPHIYVSNDPALPGFNPNYESLPVTYNFSQGKNKFEADWSNLPIAFNAIGGIQGNAQIVPANAPIITAVTPLAQNDMAPFAFNAGDMFAMNTPHPLTMNDAGPLAGSFQLAMLSPVTTITNTLAQPPVLRITGLNFGIHEAYSTVTLSGNKLAVRYWSDTRIDVTIMPDSISGPLTVATSTGISNAMQVNIVSNPYWADYMAKRSVYVDAGNTGSGDGTRANPWKTINEALDHLPALLPRYIFVAPGTYNEHIRIKASDVRIIGAGPKETVIDGGAMVAVAKQGINGGGPVFTIGRGGVNGRVNNTMISGFTVKGGSVKDDVGAGIFGDYGNGHVDINNCIITRNGGYYGGGIWLHKSNHNVSIWSNIIAENGNSGGYGGGISINDEPEYGPQHAEPDHTTDDHNPGPPPGTYRIFNNLIFHNLSPDYGGGICLYEVKDRLNVTGNIILENRSNDHGGGLFLEDTGPADISGNILLRNYSADDGGAISMEDVGDDISAVKVYNNLIAENIVDDRGENNARGAGIALDDSFYVEVYNNTITGNIAAGAYTPTGGGIDSERNGHEYTTKPLGFSDPKIYNNIIWGNWRLQYDRPHSRKKEVGNMDYTIGRNYRWTPDNLHVDNPALQPEWNAANNSESFTYVRDNDVSGGYSKGPGNISSDPMFMNAGGLNWHITEASPTIGGAPAASSPKLDLDKNRRIPDPNGKVAMGAYEYRNRNALMLRLPDGILGAVKVPKP